MINSNLGSFETASSGYLGSSGTSTASSKTLSIPKGITVVSMFTDNFYGDSTITVSGATPILSADKLTDGYSIGGNAIRTHLYTFVFDLTKVTSVTFTFSSASAGCYTIVSK